MPLSDAARAKMPPSDFALPKVRKYPIQTLAQARIAIAYAARADKATKDKVYRAVWRRYKTAREWQSVKKWRKQTRKNPARTNRAKPRTSQADKPQWQEVGRRVDVLVITRSGEKLIELGDKWRLATDREEIFFVKVGARSGARANKETRKQWSGWTWGSSVDEVRKAARPNPDKWQSVGRIKKIYYDGRLAERTDGPSRRVHEFHKTYPMLVASDEGPGIKRRGSNYRVSDRGIIK